MLPYTSDSHLADIKLLAVDMDKTLLADDDTQPTDMPELIAALNSAGVVFCPASGRQGPTLELMFPEHKDDIAFCPDNGGCTIYRGKIISRSMLDHALYHRILAAASEDEGVAPVLCCYGEAYALERDRCHHEHIFKFYKVIHYLESFEELDVDANKISLLCPSLDAETRFEERYRPAFERDLYVTVGGHDWIDFMNADVSKGDGVATLCQHLGIDLTDAAAVGDTFNDIPMLERVGHSFIVANAGKHMHTHARYMIPSNNDRGVAVLIKAILAAKGISIH